MNTQEHIKNCKECGNGFHCKGFEICHVCSAKRAPPFERVPPIAPDEEYEKHMKAGMNQGMYGGKDHREAQRSLNMMYSDLANMVASKSKEELREIRRKAAHQGYIDGLFWYWVIRFALFCSACIFAFILYMNIFKL